MLGNRLNTIDNAKIPYRSPKEVIKPKRASIPGSILEDIQLYVPAGLW